MNNKYLHSRLCNKNVFCWYSNKSPMKYIHQTMGWKRTQVINFIYIQYLIFFQRHLIFLSPFWWSCAFQKVVDFRHLEFKTAKNVLRLHYTLVQRIQDNTFELLKPFQIRRKGNQVCFFDINAYLFGIKHGSYPKWEYVLLKQNIFWIKSLLVNYSEKKQLKMEVDFFMTAGHNTV